MAFVSGARAQGVPETQETDLGGTKVDLQAVTRGKKAVVILGFTRESGTQTSAWREQLSTALAGSPVVLFEAPMLEQLPFFLKGLVLGKMRKAIPAAAHAKVLPVFHHEKEWKALVKYTSGDEAWLAVIDESGAVAKVEHGPVDATRLAAVLGALGR